jgi:hypothetical protein
VGLLAKKPFKIERTKNHVIVDFRNPPKKQVLGYRRVTLPNGALATVAIMRKKGPHGGRTQIVSLWYPKRMWTPARAKKWGARIAAAKREK